MQQFYLRQIYKHIQDGIIIMDHERVILEMNPSAQRMTGWQLGGKVPYCSYCQNRQLAPGENRCYLISQEEVPYFLSEMPTYQGETLDVEMSTALMYQDEESEHKRLAQELHDGVGQSLYSISVALQAIEMHVKDHKLHDYNVERRFHSIVEINLYRVIQEALHNILKYANASSVTVRLEEIQGELRLFIHDNGSGFDTGQVEEGLGLKHMEERIHQIGGTFSLYSKLKQGTIIRVSVPSSGGEKR